MTAVASDDLNQVELLDVNPDPRCPVVLLLDTSGSMEGEPIDALNEGVSKFAGFLRADPIARNRVELAIVTFGGSVTPWKDFQRAEDFKPEAYEADGGTPMGEAILTGLKLIEEQKARHRAQVIEFYRPIMLAITDGKPTDERAFAEAVEALRDAETKEKVDFYAVGVLGADMSLLRGMKTHNSPTYLKGVEFTTLFKYLSDSLSAQPTEGGQISIRRS